jgi:hypothetical protein
MRRKRKKGGEEYVVMVVMNVEKVTSASYTRGVQWYLAPAVRP